MPSTVKLGTTNVVVGKVAHGLMTMTWAPNPVADEVAFESIKASLDSVPAGAKMILNSGEFYANDLGTANLELVSRFFEKYPEYAERAFLSVKGGIVRGTFGVDSSPENLRRSVDNILAALRGKKSLDLFETARVDPKVPIEEVMNTLKGFVDEGKFQYIGLSECSAATVQRANKIAPVAAVEIEISPLSYEEETKKVLATAKELGISVLAYSPISRGLFSGAYKTPEDVPETLRNHFPRFSDKDVFNHNLELVNHFKAVAEKKSVTPAQLCIAWVGSLGEHVIPLPGSSRKSRTEENTAGGNVTFSDEELDDLNRTVDGFQVRGGRYSESGSALLWG